MAYLLENCIGTADWQCRYIRGRCCIVRRSKRGRKTRYLRAISWYHRMYDVLGVVWHKPESL